MSGSFETVPVIDGRLKPVEDFKFAVMRGSKSVTPMSFNFQSKSTSQLQCNIVVPSFETLIDKNIRIAAQMSISVDYTVPAPLASVGAGATPIFGYGQLESLAPFPLHQSFSNSNCFLNSQNISVQTSDVLPVLMQLYTKHDLAQLHSCTPCQKDTYGVYSDGLYANNNTLGSFSQTPLDNYYHGNGSWVLDSVTWNNSGTITDILPTINQPNLTGGMNIPAGTQTFTITFSVEEPLLGLSPWTWINSPYNQNAIYGVNNLSFLFNLQSNASRIWRTANSRYIANSAKIVAVPKCEMRVVFLTPHDDMLFPKKSIHPYTELVRYATPIDQTIIATPANSLGTEITAQNLQLNSIFDRIFVNCPKVRLDCTDPDAFLPITRCNMTFNNVAGLLTTSNQVNLWDMSVKYGGSNQSFYEFSGKAFSTNGASAGSNGVVTTVGSVLILEPLTCFGINESFYAPSSIGAFNLNLKITVAPRVQITGGTYQIMMTIMNSGIFVSEAGTASKYLAILNKEDVLKASREHAYTNGDVKRMVGGGIFDTLSSIVGNVLPIAKALAPVAKGVLGAIPDSRAQGASNLLGSLGFGVGGKRDQRLH